MVGNGYESGGANVARFSRDKGKLPEHSTNSASSSLLTSSRPRQVYTAAVQDLQNQSQNQVPNGRPPSPGALKRRVSYDAFRPGALSKLANEVPKPGREDGRVPKVADGGVLASEQSSGALSGGGGDAAEDGGDTAAARLPLAEATNRSLSLLVTEEKPLGDEVQPPVASPAAAHAPAAVSRNIAEEWASDHGSSSRPGASHLGANRPPFSRPRYNAGPAAASIQRQDGVRIPLPSRGAASALRRQAGPSPAPRDASRPYRQRQSGVAQSGELVSYLERLSSTLQSGGSAHDILAASTDATALQGARRNPAAAAATGGHGPHAGSEALAGHGNGHAGGSGAAVSRAHQLLTPSGAQQAAPSPKGPFSKPAQMLVDAVRSKDDARLQEVIGQLRGFNARDERVKGIDDRHAVTGRTALHEAVMLNRLTSVQVLLRAGADPNVGHSTQGPPLLHAAAWGETALVDALVLCGSGIDASDCAEYTALHYAVVGDHLDTAQILIGHGADTRRCNDEGRTPSELATSAAMVELLTQAESRRERPRSAGPHRATPQEVEEALERLRTAAAEVLPQSPQLSETSGSPMSRMSPGGTQNPSRRSCEGPQPGVMLEDLVGHMERDASGTQPSKPPCGEALATKDPDTPPLLRDVSPPRSPSCQPTTPTATSQPKLPLTCRSDGQGEQATGWSPLPRLSYAGTASEHGSRPASGSRPGTGIFDPSGRPNNPRAAEAAARAAAAVGTPVTGLNQRAAQMFYQSIEVQTGDIVWTQGELLGEGAYGKVYAGLNQHTGELMAVKVLPLNMGSGASDENKLHLQALERELGMYRKFQHRHIVGYLAAHMDFKTNTMYMFLEYVPGGSISSMLQRFGAFSEELTRKFTRELLMGLEYLHGCKVIHRDLKGGNVLVTKSGRVKLADFGASKAYHEATITDGMKSIRGSVYWMAPEVIKGTGYGRRADIWSVGCTVLEMLTATHPWPDLDNHWSAMFHIAKAKSGPPIPKNVSGLCREFLESCLQVEAHRRPTATELLQHPFVCQIPNALREAEMARGLNHSL